MDFGFGLFPRESGWGFHHTRYGKASSPLPTTLRLSMATCKHEQLYGTKRWAEESCPLAWIGLRSGGSQNSTLKLSAVRPKERKDFNDRSQSGERDRKVGQRDVECSDGFGETKLPAACCFCCAHYHWRSHFVHPALWLRPDVLARGVARDNPRSFQLDRPASGLSLLSTVPPRPIPSSVFRRSGLSQCRSSGSNPGRMGLRGDGCERVNLAMSSSQSPCGRLCRGPRSRRAGRALGQPQFTNLLGRRRPKYPNTISTFLRRLGLSTWEELDC